MNSGFVFASLGWVLLLSACVGTETGNPLVDQRENPPGVAPPEYENPPAFDPPTDGSSGEPCSDFPRPKTSTWWRLGSLVVGMDRYRGLVTVDVTDPANPALLGGYALPAARQFYQVEVTEAEGVREVVVALSEAPSLAEDALPAESSYALIDKVFRFDVSDPSEPRLLQELTLDGSFQHFLLQDDRAWVMTTSSSTSSLVAGYCPSGEGCYTPELLHVTGYQNVNASWQAEDSVELPTARYALLSEFGVLSVSSDEVHVARMENGVFGAVHSVSADTSWISFSALRLTATELQLVLQEPLSNQPRVLLQRFVATEAGFSAPSETLLGEPDYNGEWRAWLSGDHLFVSLGREQVTAQVWALSEDETAVLALPSPMQHIVPLSALGNKGDAVVGLVEGAPLRAIAWRGEPDALPDTMSLVAIVEGSVEILDDWELPAAPDSEDFSQGLGFQNHHAVSLHGTHLVARERGNWGPIAAIAIEEDSLVEAGSFDTEYSVGEIAVGDDYIFAGDLGLRSGSWSEGELRELRWTDYVAFHTSVLGTEASLLTSATYPTRTQALRLERDGQRWDFPLSETRGVVLPSNGVLLVPSLNDSLCDIVGDNCVEQQPQVMVFTLGDVPELAAEVPLPNEVKELASTVNEAEFSWLLNEENPPLQLSDGRWLFTAELRRACDSESECEALGAEAFFNETENFWRGNLYQRFFYALNVDPDGSATWSEPAIVTLSGGSSSFGRAFVGDGRLHVARQEHREESPGSPEHVSVFVDRFEVYEDGAFRALPRVNIPGFPVGTLEDGRLLTVAPRTGTGGGGTLQRVRLEDDAAFIDDSLDIDGSYVDLELIGNTAIYLSGPSELCSGPRLLNTITLGSDLELRSSLELSPDWAPWELAAFDATHVILSRGYDQRHFAAFELDESAAASFVSLRSSHCGGDPGNALEFSQGVLSCAAGGFGVERLEF